jgi:hypothetical protein
LVITLRIYESCSKYHPLFNDSFLGPCTCSTRSNTNRNTFLITYRRDAHRRIAPFMSSSSCQAPDASHKLTLCDVTWEMHLVDKCETRTCPPSASQSSLAARSNATSHIELKSIELTCSTFAS